MSAYESLVFVVEEDLSIQNLYDFLADVEAQPDARCVELLTRFKLSKHTEKLGLVLLLDADS